MLSFGWLLDFTILPYLFVFQLSGSILNNTPTIILSQNRPHYLFRTLISLLSKRGARRDLVTVEQMGFYEEPRQVTALLNVRCVQHRQPYDDVDDNNSGKPSSRDGVSPHHLRLALASAFQRHPVIITLLQVACYCTDRVVYGTYDAHILL